MYTLKQKMLVFDLVLSAVHVRLPIEYLPDAPIHGKDLEAAKKVLDKGKAAADKLLNESRKLLMKLTNKEDDLFKDLSLCLVYIIKLWFLKIISLLDFVLKTLDW